MGAAGAVGGEVGVLGEGGDGVGGFELLLFLVGVYEGGVAFRGNALQGVVDLLSEAGVALGFSRGRGEGVVALGGGDEEVALH